MTAAKERSSTAERPGSTETTPTKSRLVVVGNGMSGARALEEILARGGGEQFAIEVFGDEPYGNYNRILLSEVLAHAAGSREHADREAVDNEDADGEDELYLNPLDWYDDNGITLHAGVRIVRIDRHAKVVYGDDGSVTPYDTLVLATGSRSFFPPMEGMWDVEDRPDAGRLRVPLARRRDVDAGASQGPPDRCRHRRRTAGARGRGGAAGARRRRARRAPHRGADEPAARGRGVEGAALEARGHGPAHAPRGEDERDPRPRRCRLRREVHRRVDAGLRHGRRHRRHPPQHRPGDGLGSRDAARDRRRRQAALGRRRLDLRGRRVRAAPWRGLRRRRAAVGTGRRPRRCRDRNEPRRRVPRVASGDEAQGRRGRRGTDGCQDARAFVGRVRPVLRDRPRRVPDRRHPGRHADRCDARR